MQTPLVSIIIPTFNRAHLISETLDSVLAQTYANWECIIVDDGSNDDTLVIINEFLKIDSRVQYFSRPETKLKGPSSCRNYGLEKAKGEYVIFLDSDDLLADFCLENRIKFALANQEYDFWIFKMLAFEGTIDKVKFVYENIQEENESLWCINEFMKGVHPFVITGPLWKKNILLEINGFNEKLTMIEDPELHLRALKMGYQLKYANFKNPDCYYRLCNNKLNNSINLNLKNNLLFFEIHLNKEQKEVVFYFKKMINKLVLDNNQFIAYYQFCILGLNKKILPIKNVFFGLIILIYNILGLNNFQYIGYNFFKKKFNNF